MVLKQCGLFLSQGSGDGEAFVGGEDDAAERIVDGEVVVEGAGVLGYGLEGAAEGAEGAAVDGVGVGYAVYVWAGGVHGVVNHVCFDMVSYGFWDEDEDGRGEGRVGNIPAVFSSLQGPPSTTWPSALTRIRSEALRRGQATPKGFTQKEVGSTGSWKLLLAIIRGSKKSARLLEFLQLNPQILLCSTPPLNRVSLLQVHLSPENSPKVEMRDETHPQSDMSSNSLIKSQLRENPKSQCQPPFLILPLLQFILKGRWAGYLHLDCCLFLGQAWFVSCCCGLTRGFCGGN